MTKFVLWTGTHLMRFCGLMALVVSCAAMAQDPLNTGELLPGPEGGPTAELERQANLPEPPVDDRLLSRCVFFHKRGVANLRLGHYEHAIADLKQALPLAEPEGRADASTRWGKTVRGGADIADTGEWCKRPLVETDLENAYYAKGDLFSSIALLQAIVPEYRKSNVRRYAMTQLSLIHSYASLGMVNEADEAFNRASEVLPEIKKRRDWESLQDNINDRFSAFGAWLQELHGNFAEAEKLRRSSLTYAQRFLKECGPEDKRIAKVNLIFRVNSLSNILLIQGKSGEAEYFASEALSETLSTYAFGTAETSRALDNLAHIKVDRGEIGDAARYEDLAVQALEKSDIAAYSTALADRRAELALILNMQGRWEDALRLFEVRERGLRSNPEQWKIYGARHIEWAMAMVRTGHADSAVQMLQRILDYQLKLPFSPPRNIAYSRAYLGAALEKHGDDGQALAYFQQALPLLLRQEPNDAGNETVGQVRLYMLRLILDSYLELLGRLQGSAQSGQDWATEAFRTADIARESSVQQAVAVSAARARLPDAALAELARREQDDTNRIEALTKVLDHAVSGQQHSDQAIASLQRQLAELTTEQASLRNEIAQRFPDYADLVNPRPATPADVQRVLKQGEALVSIYSGERQTYVWTITQTSMSWRIVPLSRNEIANAVARLRGTLDLEDGRLKAFDVTTAHNLYASLLGPDAAMWVHATVLNIVPHGALGTLPFSVLLTTPTRPVAATNGAAYAAMPWLNNQVAIVQQSSASSLVAQRNVHRQEVGQSPFIGFGDPLFSAGTEIAGQPASSVRQLRVPPTRDVLQPVVNQAQQSMQPVEQIAQPNLPTLSQAFALLPPLPDTADELTEIARTLGASPQANLYLGARASKANVERADLARYRVIAFATHGLKAGELAGLDQPALALANPELTHESNDDGFLKLEDVLGLKLNADWVILSACNTASPDGSANEAVSGLGRGFFYAGARSVLVSNWAVESRSARLLTTGLFRQTASHPDLTRAEALRRSMLDLMKEHPAEYGHPVFWAPFSLAGDGR